MDCQEMDLIESRSERSNFGNLLLFDNFLKNGLMTFFIICFVVNSFLLIILISLNLI